METREVLGLDDHGRELILTRMTSSRGDHAVEMVTAFSSDGKAEVIYCETIEDELAVAAVYARQKQDRWYSEIIQGVSTGRLGGAIVNRGSGKSNIAMQMFYGANFADLETRAIAQSGAVIISSDSMSLLDGTGKERVKLGKLDLRLQGQPNRKPQPNRGPLGRKDWL